MRVRTILLSAIAITLPLTLAGCSRGDAEKAKLAEQDDNLTSDPKAKAALNDPIMIDPEMVGSANKTAATPASTAIDGSVPATGTARDTAAENDATAAAGNKMMRAPEATVVDMSNCKDCGTDPVTLGERATQMGAGSGKCDAKLSYSTGWANRMPAALPVYPRAALKEAAGVSGQKCNIRVVNFETRAGKQAVLDFYYTMARRNGYSADHEIRNGEHFLGGTRGNDDSAFVVILRETSTGAVDVDLVANNGR
jgi:hypothetical protein